MEIKSYKNLIAFITLFAVISVSYLLFHRSVYFEQFSDWAEQYKYSYFFILILLKILGIIWPPLPGGIFTLGSVPIIGWELAYLSDFIGSLIGGSMAFWLSKNYGKKFLSRIFDDKTIEKLENFPLKKGREYEIMFILLTLGGSFIEIICYGVGLIKGFRFRYLFIPRVISHLLIGIPTFFLLEGAFSGKNTLINIVFIILLGGILWRLRTRYIEL